MSTAATVISNFGTYDWNARIYDTLSLASRLAAAVKNRASAIRLAYLLYDLNVKLSSFLESVNAAMEGKVPSPPDADTITPQTLRGTADNLEQLHRTLNYVLEGAKRVGLTNSSLTAGSLRAIQKHAGAIGNLADWFDLAAQPEAVSRIFERSHQEQEKGQLVDISQIE